MTGLPTWQDHDDPNVRKVAKRLRTQQGTWTIVAMETPELMVVVSYGVPKETEQKQLLGSKESINGSATAGCCVHTAGVQESVVTGRGGGRGGTGQASFCPRRSWKDLIAATANEARHLKENQGRGRIAKQSPMPRSPVDVRGIVLRADLQHPAGAHRSSNVFRSTPSNSEFGLA